MYLNCHTYYSLRYGTFSPEALCELAQQHQLESLALTDINNTSACLNFLKMAGDYGLKPVIGIDFRNGVQQQYVGLAKNNEGFRQLNEHLSVQLHRAQEFKDEAPSLPDCFIIYPFEKIAASKKTNFRDNEFIGVSVESFRKLKF
ncbi:MAG: PHP domain-containing protein [Salegentibacter sp.]